jgi:hypothetical protein
MGHPGADAVRECARIAASELGWTGEQTSQEVAAVNQFYAIGPTAV